MANEILPTAAHEIDRRCFLRWMGAVGSTLSWPAMLTACPRPSPTNTPGCPTLTMAPGAAGVPAAWGAPTTLTATSGGFGGPIVPGPALVGASAAIICQDGKTLACSFPALGWSDKSIVVTLPAQPLSQADCPPPYLLRIVIPRVPPPNDTCEAVIEMVALPPPPPAVPTVVFFFENPATPGSFSGRALIAVPSNSSLPTPLSVGALSAILTPIVSNPAVAAAYPLLASTVPMLLAASSSAESAPTRRLCTVKAGTSVACYAKASDSVDGLCDFFEILYDPFPRVSAEDIMSSFVVIGAQGTTIHLFNAPDFSAREGAMDVTVGPELIVRCDNLTGVAPPAPATTPAGRITITRNPNFCKGLACGIRTFDKELSSLRFDSGTSTCAP